VKAKRIGQVLIVALIATACALLILAHHGEKAVDSKTDGHTLKLAFQGTWKLPLTPASQHMMIEDAILANEFESLLVRGENGLVLPSAAKSFTINDDFTVYEFKIDERRKFSDGTPLTAHDFKRSWEHGLWLRKNSANRNSEDVLKPLVGFDEFEKSGSICGIEVIDDLTIRIRFKMPFRMALMHLTGARFAAFKENGAGLIGTGRFVIQQISNEKLILNPNIYHPDGTSKFSKIEIYGLADPYKAIEAGDVDLVAYSAKRFKESNDIGATFGVEDYSAWLHLNSLNDRFFSDIRLRQAFQFLIHTILKERKADIDKNPVQFKLDAQTFLPLQAGRISDDEAELIIKKGEQYVNLLIEKSKNNPIKTSIYGGFSFILDDLKSKGLSIENKTFDSIPDLMNDFYLAHTQDALLCGASVHLSDPDGMYHLLGKFGAITSPIIHTPKVVDLFEAGRSLVDQDEIPKFYEEVSRAILEESPTVHIGFIAHGYLYRKDRLKADRALLERHFDQILQIFHPIK
jgi:ABC-type transport system substrate-binding protein